MRILLIALIVMIVLCMIIYAVSRHFWKTAICIGMVCVVLVGSLGLYLLNNEFKHIVNMNFFPLKQHTYIIENQGHSVPLPPKTTMMYRMSDVEAVYLTKTQAEQIVEFYSKVADGETFSAYKIENGIKLSFCSNGNYISVVIDNDDENVKFTMDITNETFST